MDLTIQAQVGGRFRMVAIKPDGGERLLADWFDNLITDAGMNRMSDGAICIGNVSVGSGSAAPSFSDTALQTFVAQNSSVEAWESGTSTSAPYYGWGRRKFRFNAGVAAGTLSEVGAGWDGTLFSRTLIKDSEGNPTSVTILADEVLDVTYELRLYAPSSDSTFDIDISGTTHACVCRAAVVTSTNWCPFDQFQQSYSTFRYACSGDIGAVTASPSGTQQITHNVAWEPYVANSFTRDVVVSFPLEVGNFAGGVKSLFYGTGRYGAFQCSFTPPIMKDGNKILNLNVRFTWARYGG